MTTPDRIQSERLRADRLLVERGLFDSRARAQAAIEAGLVRANGVVVRKPSEDIARDAALTATPAHPYVSRGGVKLAAALDQFGIDPQGCVCLDVGASTGGFTEVLLVRGARRIYAVDVGKAQLHASLRGRPEIVSLEETDIRTLMHNGLMWAINGIAAKGHVHDPLLTFARGRSYVLELVNDTAWHHPMHLHGFYFRVLRIGDGRRDEAVAHGGGQLVVTQLVRSGGTMTLEWAVEREGNWLFHCHIMAHVSPDRRLAAGAQPSHTKDFSRRTIRMCWPSLPIMKSMVTASLSSISTISPESPR